jgi:protein-histidine pros-kinase
VIAFAQPVLEDEDKRLEESQRDTLNVVLSSAQHLLSLVNDNLDTAKVEAGKVEL